MSKGQTKKTREAAGNRRKLTRAEKKQIAEAIRKAKGDGKARTAQQTIPYLTASGDNITLFINLDTVMQIYENLLSNSIRYAKSDIAISVVIENNNLVISVSDDGCGFKNIEIEKATLPFYKSSKDISTEHLGLGLNISKILSERHGGNIQIANNKAGGACVTEKINCNES